MITMKKPLFLYQNKYELIPSTHTNNTKRIFDIPREPTSDALINANQKANYRKIQTNSLPHHKE